MHKKYTKNRQFQCRFFYFVYEQLRNKRYKKGPEGQLIMILDYNYNNYSRRLDVSYIEDNGSKQILSFNVNRFKAYYSTPNGSFTNWAGDKCDIRWVEKPSKFEIHTFLTELDERYKKLLHKRAFPKVYTFDIETLADENGEYSEPEFARCPISTISVCSPELNTLVLGTLRFSDAEKKVLDKNFEEYINNTEFFKKLNLKMPYVRYVYFQTEEEMIKYFLQNIVSKVPILTGWNCIKYDWNYIVNRIKNYYPSLSIKLSSCNRRTTPKRFQDRYGNEFRLPIPEHTLILDMMDIIETEDKTVLPMKESMKLDYIASASMGIHKIEYTRSLDDLYRDDYGRYVFYNSIDSVLVQLINYRFKALDHIYLYSLYCNEKISSCFSKIAVSEALVFKDFYELGIKIAYEDRPEPARSALLGAYVKKPVPGIHSFVSCNDFAALYPSSMRTCNLSFENYIGAFWDTKKLEEFKEKRSQYVVIGPNVLVNEGTADKPKLGRVIATYLDEEKLAPYRKNTKKYFVSVNGCVYYNDKDYAFRRIQSKLQAARDHDKYLGKKIDAMVLSDIDLILEGHNYENQAYPEDIIETLEKLGINDIKYTDDFKKYTKEQLESTRLVIQNEVIYLDSNQLAMKLMMNSIYGGASNINFYWYNMNLANDITGEARDLIHRMEHHIPDWFRNNWTGAKWLHEKLGIEVDEEEAKKILETAYFVPESVDPDTYNKTSFVLPVYGDSCHENTFISTIDGDIKIKDLFEQGETIYKDRGKEFAVTNKKIINFDGEKQVHSEIKYIVRHKTSKQKWEISTNTESVIITNDHSMIVIENGKMVEKRPEELKPGMIVNVNSKNGFVNKKIEYVKNTGSFENEYVYDIEVYTDNPDMHNFYGNSILIHNTDSVDKNTVIITDNGEKTIEQLYKDNFDSKLVLTDKGHEIIGSKEKVLNWSEDKGLHYDNIKYIMRHKVIKAKWRLRGKDGKEIFVTNDHSLIVFRDGKKIEVKPWEIKPGIDKILVVKQ